MENDKVIQIIEYIISITYKIMVSGHLGHVGPIETKGFIVY